MSGMKGVAMSAGRQWIKEIYVGFLLLLLSFLYLSHLTADLRKAEIDAAVVRIKRQAMPLASSVKVPLEIRNLL